jgi:hypothetical protein
MINKELLLYLLKKSHKLKLEYMKTLYKNHKFFKDDFLLNFDNELVKNITEDYENKIKIKTKNSEKSNISLFFYSRNQKDSSNS